MRYTPIMTLTLALLLAAGSIAFGSQEWEAGLKLQAGVAKNKLTLGQKADASDGIDGHYDVPALLQGQFKAYFLEGGKKLWRDVKASGSAASWDVVVEAAAGEAVTASWTQNRLPQSSQVQLTDLTSGAVVDMTRAGSYGYINDGARTLRIEIK